MHGQTCGIQRDHMVPLKPKRRGEARRERDSGGEKRTTHDFHTGNAFAHRFDLRKRAAVIWCESSSDSEGKGCALFPRLRGQG